MYSEWFTLFHIILGLFKIEEYQLIINAVLRIAEWWKEKSNDNCYVDVYINSYSYKINKIIQFTTLLLILFKII